MVRLVAVLLLIAVSAYPDKPDHAGIWGIWGKPLSRDGRPWYKGHVITVDWRDIEPADNQFDWRKLDAAVSEAASNGLYVMAMVYTGAKSPDWLYSRGVPLVTTDFKGESRFPFYLGPTFRKYFKRMIDRLAAHLDRELPVAVRSKLIAVQCPVGASGDPHPYKVAGEKGSGKVGAFGSGATRIDPQRWIEYQKEMFRYYYEAFAPAKPRIHCLFNTIYDEELTSWAHQNLPGMWNKTNRIGDRYQNNGEARPGSYQLTLPRDLRSFHDGRAIRARSEMDLTDMGWFTEAPLWNMYWTQLWGLHNGQDIHNQVESDLKKEQYYPAFDFYSRYAGYKDPRDSHGAWCALRGGLDYADTGPFPEARFGAVGNGSNRSRYEAILRLMAPFGARQSETGYGRPTNWKGMDDVGFEIHQGNFELYLSQRDPDQTSVALWRVGPQQQPHGRFARRFDHASGKDAMYFDIDDGFFAGNPLKGAYEVQVRVVYLDEGKGVWALQYDAVSNPQKTTLEIRKTGSGAWKEAFVTLKDAHFGNRGPRQSDLVLFSVDGQDDTFHMVEVTRTKGDRRGYWGE